MMDLFASVGHEDRNEGPWDLPVLRVLDLFAGLEGWSKPFRERGHEVMSLEIDSKFEPDICADILEWDPSELPCRPDVICASPPCEGFSVMRIGANWTGPRDDPPHAPKTDKARMSQRLVERTLEIVDYFEPEFWVMENPRAKLRKLPLMQPYELRTVTYCKYWSGPEEGPKRMKPTDLWSDRWPSSLELRPQCKGLKKEPGCHTPAPRGSRTGSQGMDSALSAKIPYELALEFCLACEKDHVV